MRKLLLATVAALGASMGVAAVADAQTAASPAPGTVTVRLNGRFRFFAYGAFDRDADNNLAGSATGVTGLTGTNKLSNYGFSEYARLYPGFDGVAANGLKYGAALEIRQDQSSGAGGGLYGSISQQNRARAALYFRREWGYIGTDQLGTIRFGTTDGPASLYLTGNYENFNDGGLNGDVQNNLAQNALVTWPFADVGNLYATNKAVYLSPQLFGLDFGVSYEPSTANFSVNSNCGSGSPVGTNFVNEAGSFTTAAGANGQNVSGPGCDRLASSPVNSESARRRNTFEAVLRYRATFGGVGVAVAGGYIGGSHVQDNQSGVAFNDSPLVNNAAGNPVLSAAGVGTAATVRRNYNGLSVGDFGVALTFGGLSVGGKYQYGRFTGQWGLVPDGLPSGEAWLVGSSYTIGPVVVGAHYLDYKNAGDFTNAAYGRQRRERGVGAGGTYSLAPGLSLFASYIWSDRKQNGFNFITGQGVTAATPFGNPNNNRVTSQLFALGTSLTW